MLHLYQSNRLEALAEMLATLHIAQPLTSPFAPEQVVVQSQGMRRYLNQFLAKKQGIAANIKFSLPAGLTFRLMRETMPDTPELNPFDTEVMRWRLFALFQSPEFQSEHFQAAREVLQTYLQNGEYATYQLAGQLADVFDQYLVYRPDWIETWHAGGLVAGLADEQIWQATLWRYLDDGRQSAPHRVKLWQNLMRHLDNPPDWLPERFLVFGIATLAPMYLELLIKLSQTREVHIFALNPSENYWGQVIEPAQILNQDGDPDLTLQGHPLLASLGKQGRDFFDALAEVPRGVDIDVYDEADFSGSLLHTLQQNLQTQTLPNSEYYLQNNNLNKSNILDYLKQADRSIQIHSAHSPLRELQILKDQILDLLNKNPDWQAHDIAILTPHIEPYAPYIHAVFGQAVGGGQALPYSLSDVKLSRRQPLLYALEQTLQLLSSRFEVEQFLPLLESDLVLQTFDLCAEDVPLLHDTIRQLQIHWGADKTQRAQFGDTARLFTWQQGLERLVLGWMLPENQRQTLWQGMSAWHTRPEHGEVLSRFTTLVRTLTQIQREWQQPAPLAMWTARIRALIAQLFTPQADDREAIQQLEQSLAAWLAESELAGWAESLSQNTVMAHLQGFLHQADEAGFLRGGITFCGMVPMRSLPFKMIGLIGLNDGDFPRHVQAASFDLIAKHPKKGDRARRDDDRYLFLEAILSARETLYLSFVGKDIRTDEARAPSTLIHELVDCVAEMTGTPAKTLLKEWLISHPLQAFSRQYFSGSLKNSRQDYADALNAEPEKLGEFFRQPENEIATDTSKPIEQKAFLQFWRNPVRSYLRDHLQWETPHTGTEWDSAEPFEPQKTRLLSDAYVAARREGRHFDDLANELSAQSLLPAGELGEWVKRDFAAQAAALDSKILHSRALPERSGVLESVSGSLNYRLSHDYEIGQVIDASQFLSEWNEHGQLSSADKIELLLQHLIFCAATPEAGRQPESRQTHLIKLPDILTLPAIEQSVAKEILSLWISTYQQGKHAPQPFFPRVQLAAAHKLFSTKKDDTALDYEGAVSEAAKIYHRGYRGFAQADYPEVKLVYGRNPDAEPPYLSDLFMNLTENLFTGLSGCLKVLQSSGEEAA